MSFNIMYYININLYCYKGVGRRWHLPLDRERVDPWSMAHGPWSMVLKSHCCLAKRHDKCPMSHATWYMTHSPCFTLSWLLTHENIYDYSRKSWTKERCSQKRCQQNSPLKREKLKGCHPKPIKWSKSYASSLNPKTTRLPWSQVLPLQSCQDTNI